MDKVRPWCGQLTIGSRTAKEQNRTFSDRTVGFVSCLDGLGDENCRRRDEKDRGREAAAWRERMTSRRRDIAET